MSPRRSRYTFSESMSSTRTLPSKEPTAASMLIWLSRPSRARDAACVSAFDAACVSAFEVSI